LRAEEIYESVLDDDAFAALPQRLGHVFGARSAVIHCHYADGDAGVISHSGYFSAEQMQDYGARFAALDPWAEAAALHASANVATNLEDLVSQPEFEHSAFYNEYIRTMGDDTFHCMGIRIVRRWGAAMLALQRGKTQLSFDTSSVAFLQESALHIRHMLALRGKLSAVSRRAGALESALDHLGVPVLLASREGRLVFANALAEEMLRRGDLLELKDRALRAPRDGSREALSLALARACDPACPSASTILLTRLDRPPVPTSIYPISAAPGSRQALVVVEERLTSEEVVVHRLQSLFGLTRAEAEIAKRIASGTSPKDIAACRGVSVDTVRTQIKSLAAKLDCRRQGEISSIVNLVAGSAVPAQEGRSIHDAR
jgi:DNA-binding CsgD family transcriptional regulator